MSGKEGRENVSGEDKRLPEMGSQEANRGFADDKGGRVMGEEGLPRMRGFPAGPHTWYSASQHPGAIAQIFQVTGDLLRRILCLRAMRNAMMV